MRSLIRARRVPRLVAVVAAASLVFAACADDNGDDDASDTTDDTVTEETAPSVDSGAATLRADLTNLLQEHVYLAGTATGTAIAGGDFESAAATLDENTVALSEAVTSVYGEEAGDRFAELWRTHIGFFVDYTNAAVAGDAAAMQAALDDLDGYVADIAAFLTSANPEVEEDVVVESFNMHIGTLIAAIDAQAAGDPQQFALLRTAAQHMPGAAEYLASVIVAQMPDDFDGSVDSPAATLRSGLTSLLQEHVYLAGTATGTAIAGGNFDAAAATLDENSVALSEAIASVYGNEAGEAFLGLWRDHIGMFVDYTNGAVGGDEAARMAALDELDAYSTDFAAFLSSANPEIDEDVVVENLGMHIDTLIAAIDAQVAGDPQQFTLLRTAAQHMPSTAEYLATVIVAQMPDDFS